MENHPVRIEGGARVETLRPSPSEELLDVLGSDVPCVGFGCQVFGEELEDVFVFLMGEGFAEGPHVFEERLDRFFQRERLFVFFEAGEFEAAFFRAQFKALAFLGLQRLGGSVSGGGAKALAVLTPLNKEAAARGPLDASLDVSFEGDVGPTLGCLDPPQDIDPCHSATPPKSGH